MAYDAKIPYGLRDDRLVHVSQLSRGERGSRCGCVCPECKSPLTARMGEVNRHHFAHSGGNRPCAGGAETGIHLAAKQMIADNLAIPVPLLQASLEGKDSLGYSVRESKVIFKGCDRQPVDRAKLEHHLGDIRPDLIVTLAGNEILIEVAVTHYIDDEKLRRLEARGLRCVEIDLGDIPRTVTPAELESYVYDRGRAYWIVNPKLAAAEAALQPRLQQAIDRENARIEKARQEREEEGRRLREHYARMEAHYQKLEEAAEKRRQEDEKKRRQEEEERRQRTQRELQQAAEARQRREAEEKQRQQLAWEEERSQLDLDGMRGKAQHLLNACQDLEAQWRHASVPERLALPMARRHVPRAMAKMEVTETPRALATSIAYDWMFNVSPQEWKLVAFFEEVYTHSHLRKQEWVSILDVERCIKEFGYRPARPLLAAEELLNTAQYYRVLSDDPGILALAQLPRPLGAVAEFLGELASHGMIQLRPGPIDQLALIPELPHRWR